MKIERKQSLFTTTKKIANFRNKSCSFLFLKCPSVLAGYVRNVHNNVAVGLSLYRLELIAVAG